jgi:tRNA G10  N-methylase Trm11
MLCLRLGSGKKPGKRGSLSTDLSTLLVRASNPSNDDVFLDPFGGSGALVEARTASAFRSATYSDNRLSDLRSQLSPRLVNNRKVRVLGEDALMLLSVPDGSVSAIVTDPPWGEHEDLGMPYREFADAMMRSFDRVLNRRRGRLVLMVSRREASAVTEMWKPAGLQVEHVHEILVNGHPASVLVGERPQA